MAAKKGLATRPDVGTRPEREWCLLGRTRGSGLSAETAGRRFVPLPPFHRGGGQAERTATVRSVPRAVGGSRRDRPATAYQAGANARTAPGDRLPCHVQQNLRPVAQSSGATNALVVPRCVALSPNSPVTFERLTASRPPDDQPGQGPRAGAAVVLRRADDCSQPLISMRSPAVGPQRNSDFV